MAKKRIGTRNWLDEASTARVANSGLEVWLYDEASREAIVASGAMTEIVDEAILGPLFSDGRLAAYSLYQDDALAVAVIVGALPTAAELKVGEWLEPQTALLRLPSGELCIESNDACRIRPETPAEAGARIDVPPGDYRLTLYRVDYEALDRDGRTWDGPHEVIVLTPGGTAADAADGILPFQPRRDLSWSGRYTVDGRTLSGLVWFDDSWDTFIVNIDRGAVERLGLTPGSCLRATVPEAGITLVTTYAGSWKEAAALEPPDDVALDEYGFAALCPMQSWNGAEALFCRRDRTASGIEARHKHLWLPATVELLEAKATKPDRIRGPLIHDMGKRAYWRADLRGRHYYDDLQLLTARLMGRVSGLPWGEPMPLARAVDLVDEAMASVGLEPLGDFAFDAVLRQGPVEYTNRMYGGPGDIFAVIWGSKNTFEVFFYSALADGTWVLTGTVSDAVARAISARPGLSVRAAAGRLASVFEAHRTHVDELGGAALQAPRDLAGGVALYDGYLDTALGG